MIWRRFPHYRLFYVNPLVPRDSSTEGQSCRCFLWCDPDQSVEQTVAGDWDTTMPTWIVCNFVIDLSQKFHNHDDVIKWKHSPLYWPFMQGIHRSAVNSPHKGQWRGALMFSFIYTLNKRLTKQSWGWWFETPSRSLWRYCNDTSRIPRSAPFCYRNMHMCAHFRYKRVHFGILVWCIVGFVRWVY